MFAITGVLCGWAAWVDAREHRLPNALVLSCYPVVLLGLAGSSWLGRPSWSAALIGILVMAGPIGLLWLVGGRLGMGPGDVKLAVPLGASLGSLSPRIAMLGLALAFVVGGLVALVQMVRRRASVRIAFGPYLMAGWMLALLAFLMLGPAPGP